MDPREVLGMLSEQLEQITKRLDNLDEKLDTYYGETIRLKNDVSWIKGSAKIGGTLLVTVIGGIITAFIKLIPNMN